MSSSTEVPRPAPPVVKISWVKALLVLVAVIVLFAALSVPISRVQLVNRFVTQLRSQSLLWGLWFLLLPLVFAAARRAHHYGLPSVRGLAVHAGACVSLSLIHCVLWGSIRYVINNPDQQEFRLMVGNMVAYVYASDLLRYVVLAAVYHMLAYQVETRDRMLSEARLRSRLAKARLDALEARLHPHFLFNTLNTVTALIRSDPPAAIGVVERLGDLLRAALHAEPGREVSLATELELVRRYVDIQQARFSDRLRVAIDASPAALEAQVPQMILQPLVENAVQHGIAPREAPGTVTIGAVREGDRLRLIVRDDGVGFGRASRSSRGNNGNGNGIGLSNTRERLAELYGDRFKLDVGAVDPTGTVVTIDLPYRTSTEE